LRLRVASGHSVRIKTLEKRAIHPTTGRDRGSVTPADDRADIDGYSRRYPGSFSAITLSLCA